MESIDKCSKLYYNYSSGTGYEKTSIGGNDLSKDLEYQLNYDRLFERVMDNSKILSLMGKKQSDLRPLYDGLKYEVSRCPKDFQWNTHVRMDEYLAERGMK